MAHSLSRPVGSEPGDPARHSLRSIAVDLSNEFTTFVESSRTSIERVKCSVRAATEVDTAR
jgi:hypothetical protein